MKLLFVFVALAACAVHADEGGDVTCEEVGFHRHPDDCAKFFRCVDFGYPTGFLTPFHFACPEGTIFDEVLSVCNWPQQAQPPCPPAPVTTVEVEEEEEETTPMPGPELPSGGGGGDDGDTVIISPTFSFQCQSAGIFPHDSDCAKFWLCKGDVPAELYKCPAGFLFKDEVRRCQKAEEVVCEKVSNRFAPPEPPAITLRVSELDGFFARWG